MENMVIEIKNSKDITSDIRQIIEKSQKVLFQAVDIVLLQRNWLIGKRIYEEELKEVRKENYGKNIIKKLSKSLRNEYNSGLSKSSLYSYYKFYILYKNIFQTASGQSFLSWSHYALLINVVDKKVRAWYEKEALECGWSVRTLQRNIATQYYYRILSSQNIENNRELVNRELEDKVIRLEHIKNPLMLEFLHINEEDTHIEKKIEDAIINNIQKFMMELGKGFTFVGRQYHIHTEYNDYYIDLVFYNYILKCFFLIDLKIGKITHQDVGQMDMYINMFDKLKRIEGDRPTFGMVLCTKTDEDIVKYSILKGHEQLFASVYKLYLPSELDLKAEIEHQKELFELQKEENT